MSNLYIPSSHHAPSIGRNDKPKPTNRRRPRWITSGAKPVPVASDPQFAWSNERSNEDLSTVRSTLHSFAIATDP